MRVILDGCCGEGGVIFAGIQMCQGITPVVECSFQAFHGKGDDEDCYAEVFRADLGFPLMPAYTLPFPLDRVVVWVCYYGYMLASGWGRA